MATASSRKERLEDKRKQEQRKSTLIWGSIGLAVVGLIALLLWNNLRPAAGQEFPLMVAEHISEGEDPGEYNSNPPTSGLHYPLGLPRGFYEESDLAGLSAYPQGNLVHNLEHGYIVFWYNCDLLDEAACDDLKAELSDYIDGSLVSKLIAFPWAGTDFPVVLTSWGYMLEMESFNGRAAGNFISSNRLNAPEPNAP
jgi:hypothetical protein